MHHNNIQISRLGFTLIELLVVISVISLISTILLVSVSAVRLKATDIKRISELGELQKALDLYFDDHGYYPRLHARSSDTDSSCGSPGTFQAVSGEQNSWCKLMDLLSPYIKPVAMEQKSSMYWYIYDSNSGDDYRTYGMWIRIFSKSLSYLALQDGGYLGYTTHYDPYTGEPTDTWLYEVGQQPAYCKNKYDGTAETWYFLIATVCYGGN